MFYASVCGFVRPHYHHTSCHVIMRLYFGQLDGCFEYWYSYYE